MTTFALSLSSVGVVIDFRAGNVLFYFGISFHVLVLSRPLCYIPHITPFVLVAIAFEASCG